MSRTDEEREEPLGRSSGRELWQRSLMADAPEDEAARFLDLAGFADGLLEPDERDRVAALLAADPTAAADVAAARALAGRAAEPPRGLERTIARACAILPGSPTAPGRIIAFAQSLRRRRILHDLTQWGSLAAALVVASWLGFAMGTDTSLALSQPAQSSDASFLPELLDPGSGFLRDFSESLQT